MKKSNIEKNSNKRISSFIKSHNLINRVYDMMFYFELIKNPEKENNYKNFLSKQLNNIEYVESLANFFDKKLRKNKNNIELKCNLIDLIYDLDYLKQYLN